MQQKPESYLIAASQEEVNEASHRNFIETLMNPGLPAARKFPFPLAAAGSHTSMPI
jgi:hypothetical protein